MNELETLNISELRERLVGLGMSEKETNTFMTKSSIISTIKILESRKVISTLENMKEDGKLPAEEVKRVETIEEKIDPSEERKVNKNWKSKAETMKAHLETQEQVSILVPLSEGEKAGVVEWRVGKDGEKYQFHVSGAVESVQLNGYKYFIAKGVYTRVPRQVAEVISRSQQQTLEAGSNISLDRMDPKTGRPIAESL